jgi:hypothetical protein
MEGMGIDHPRSHAPISELLDGADVVAIFERVVAEECRKLWQMVSLHERAGLLTLLRVVAPM